MTPRNESETRAELIDPQLREAGWDSEQEGIIVRREYSFTEGRIIPGAGRGERKKADYVLEYNGAPLAVIEAKGEGKSFREGIGQAKEYAKLLDVPYAYSTNGKEIYEICMLKNEERKINHFPTPKEIASQTSDTEGNQAKEQFARVPFERVSGNETRYYQEVAVKRAVDAIAEGKRRILLNLATGTGKTNIALQVMWKLFQTSWSLAGIGKRKPRMLFISDRNILSDQAQQNFSSFEENAVVRVKPEMIRRHGGVPTNAHVFVTIFQTLVGKDGEESHYKTWKNDFFDVIIVDECHRGGAKDESVWRDILEYFEPAIQIGLTATPKRKDNVDTYQYFGEPVYTYSLKKGIDDGFLTPYKVRKIWTSMDEYTYTNEDTVIQGEVIEGQQFREHDFNRKIEIEERERKRVKILLKNINQSEKTIVFCANQEHAALVRDLINEESPGRDGIYCVRVTANDGRQGEQYLKQFQDNENKVPTILTTSQKLSTGVDARNIRNIVLMRAVKSMIEFKQIIGRGTRLYDGKEYFTILDFVGATKLFEDPEWDGDPVAEELKNKDQKEARVREEGVGLGGEEEDADEGKMIKIQLADGKELEIRHTVQTLLYSDDGKQITTTEFIKNLYGAIVPKLLKNEESLRKLWSNRGTREKLLQGLSEKGYSKWVLEDIKNNSSERR